MVNREADSTLANWTADTRDGLSASSPIAEAVAAIQAGKDVDSNFRILFDRYCGPLRRFFERKGFSSDDALDLTQETFLGIYSGMKSYRREGPFEAWLYAVATNASRKRWRAQSTAMRAGREISTEDAQIDQMLTTSPAPALEEAIRQDRRAALREAVAELPDQARKCLTLRIYQGLSYDEIAVVMKLKIDTVKAHLFQAREKVKRRLHDFAFDEVER